jgi:nuclear pore complex protein Nup98-Nup96
LGTDSIKALFEPESLSGTPRDARLGFELVNLLKAVGVFGQISNASDLSPLSAASDSLAISYANSLATGIPTDPGILVLACWVLTHVADASAQSANIRDLLDRFGDILSTNQGICEALAGRDEDGLQIPMAWICSSKAIYAHDVLHDPVAEVRCLVEGGELSRAHDVISQTVGPAAVIEDDYSSLHDIVALIRETAMRRRVDWDKGAGLYFDYADLVHSEKRGAEAKKIVRMLTAELEAALAERGKSPAEKVALQMMASSVADMVRRESVSLRRHLLGIG